MSEEVKKVNLVKKEFLLTEDVLSEAGTELQNKAEGLFRAATDFTELRAAKLVLIIGRALSDVSRGEARDLIFRLCNDTAENEPVGGED